ncbi:extracellular solute-binding protein [Consotaella salsifontis]|uniref:Iron(III) transport system substrate-binding protein n=1 Tax=Consotaella salsifontis TaxID=1365950 RepID=A0A1T4PJN5_9HYPH|nr:extracellular solute-binding protein [Consotaella salsifontis]SJZ91436.1 iron(III) transport system substrate-binding protein [Consotaella salsifontis]
MKAMTWMTMAAAIVSLGATTALAADGKVVVYTAAPQEIVDKLVPAFEKASGMDVDVVKAGAGELINRLKAEKGRETVDVLWSVGSEVIEANPDLFQAYKPKESDKIVKEVATEGVWTPFTVVATSFIINTDQLAEGERPKTWKDLAKPEYEGMVSIARLDKSSSSYIQLATLLQIYGVDEGWDLYSRILDNTVLANSSGAVPKFVNDGEAAIGVANEDIANRFKNGGGPVEVVYPEDGTTAQADGMALLATPANPEGGKAFMDYMLSADAQKLVAEVGRRPVREDVTAGTSLTPLSKMKLIDYDLEWASKYHDEALAKWQDVVMSK